MLIFVFHCLLQKSGMKAGSVREFDCCHGNVREFGKELSGKMCPGIFCCQLYACIVVDDSVVSIHVVTCQHLLYNRCQ